MEYLKLIGILIIVLGFIFKLNIVFTVILSGFVTAMVAGISIQKFLAILGENFVSQRIVTLFIITLPVIGLSEQHGLKQSAEKLVKKRENLSPGALFNVYLLFRELAGFLSMRIYGLVQFVRPIIFPMAEAAVEKQIGQITPGQSEKLKARATAMENFGNFFAQNSFIGAGGVLLITGQMESLGYPVTNADIASKSMPIALICFGLGVVKNILDDRKIKEDK
ncbi:DUF969 domain-containing protein [Anaerococcus sp.]|uniref:DUF969 domain-containing protein n=1 Tax=Anaerococcus sp. TaxID=1872515 RepID=UPI00257C1A00|nr:DUF969 domain-containing protein [Anaerococcus sp.]MBS6105994.1 DUF969 domain-containing protein [Anaerococcus sp.]